VRQAKKTILAFGEVLWDILPAETILGGAPFNFAYRVNCLGDTGLMISRLGQDEPGRKAFEQITQLGLDTTFIQWDAQHPTGTVPISFDEKMNPDFVITPDVAYDYIELTDELIAVTPNIDSLCFGTLAQRNEISRQTINKIIEHSRNSLKILDINLRKNCYSLETITSSLEKANVLKLNGDEVGQLGEMLNVSHQKIPEFCKEIISKWSLKYCLVTLGEKGAFAMSDQDEKIYVPGYKVSLADSLGSGDAFTAGFVHKILRGKSISQAVQFGNILGAVVATKKGATAAVSQEEINHLLNQDVERNIYVDLMR